MKSSSVLFSCIFLLNTLLYSSATSIDLNSPKQTISVYYESLCSGCREFITDQLCPALKSMGDYYTVEFNPYGNAKTNVSTETGEITVTCQHGELECMFNTIHACALKHFSNDQTTKFICCLEANDQAGLKCSQEAGIDFKVVRNCSEGKEGLKLLYELGLKTNKLVPKHEFVPWVLLNGKYDKKEMTEILNNQDLMLVLCRHIQDPKPEVCNAVF